MTARPFTAYGKLLALNPKSFGMLVFEAPKPPEARDVGNGVHVVDVRGPLMHHASDDPSCDNYDGIKARVCAALDAGARTVVLSIDSPGGLVSGMLDTATEIRTACDAAGATLLAYADGQATSAAYALACVASRLFVPSTGIVGSIGVIDAIIDATAQDRAIGLTYSIVTSGARKSDGNPHVAITDGSLVATQTRVDSLAAIFAAHVATYRPVTVEQVIGLQAGLSHGSEAVALGLADEIATFDQVLSFARAGGVGAAMAASQGGPIMDDNEKARAALQAIIDGDGDEKAKAGAARALKAMDEEPDGDEPAKEEDAKATDDEAPPAKEPDGDEEAKAVSALAARVDRMERAAAFATRPDLSDVQRKALASVPTSALAAALSAIPRIKVNPGAAAFVAPTLGEGQGNHGAADRVVADSPMAFAMGLGSEKRVGVVRDANTITFHARRNEGAR